MDFQTSIKTCFKKYAEFSGRASRSELWWFALFCLIGGIVTAIFDTMVLGYSSEGDGPINLIFTVITTLPTIAVACRRLHDINKTGWWQLILLTVIGIVLLIIWYATEGEKKKNKYGNPIKIKK
ncbi:DUF805 domain-containing protein [Candidatus Pelagibacter sp. RS40]|uniref:DUF805 domain-containing protein n=1 Tax=Candidatus Pelagibacter sp. RS40 TaxID=1977865 RepID=UPI000A15A229|nr:DUF805 domain-containing protein [Candidatus Pelagibacter sp. RS40]ARJ49103.1 hypothetical protein B8063_03505 [Candidatus Pelagibacter sp. RS40]